MNILYTFPYTQVTDRREETHSAVSAGFWKGMELGLEEGVSYSAPHPSIVW